MRIFRKDLRQGEERAAVFRIALELRQIREITCFRKDWRRESFARQRMQTDEGKAPIPEAFESCRDPLLRGLPFLLRGGYRGTENELVLLNRTGCIRRGTAIPLTCSKEWRAPTAPCRPAVRFPPFRGTDRLPAEYSRGARVAQGRARRLPMNRVPIMANIWKKAGGLTRARS